MKAFKINIKLDFWTIGVAFLLSIIGILFIYSSSSNFANNLRYLKQILFLIISLVIYVVVANVNTQKYINSVIIVYVLGAVLLLITLLFGTTINSQKGWIKFGVFQVQFSEFCKITYIIAFATFINHFQNQVKKFSFLVISFLLIVPYLMLIFLQPDMGTALIFLFIFLMMLFVGGVNLKFLLLILGAAFIAVFIPFFTYYLVNVLEVKNSFILLFNSNSALIIMGIAFLLVGGTAFFIYRYFFASKKILIAFLVLVTIGSGIIITNGVKLFLKSYHYKRFLVFVNPDLDPAGKGYNIKQSLISIGSGQLTGQGFTKGKQNRGQFLPAEDTDFIFSLIGEEWGFLGLGLVILLYFFLIYGGLQIAYSARDFVSSLIALGITAMYMGHILINIFSSIGFFPVVGVPLPFISYGGSSMLVNYIGLGILYNIKMKRFSYNN